MALSYLKRIFGLTRVRYRGLKKNHEWLLPAFVLVNLYQHSKRLVKINQRLAPQGTQCVCRRPPVGKTQRKKRRSSADTTRLRA